MIVCSPIRTCMKNMAHLSGCSLQLLNNQLWRVVFQSQSRARCFSLFLGGVKLDRINIYQHRSKRHSLNFESKVNSSDRTKMCADLSLGCQIIKGRVFVSNQGTRRKLIQGNLSWLQRCASAGLVLGLLICYSSEPVHAEAPLAKATEEDHSNPSTASFSHGKQVYTNYSVIGIPGDGRCLFRSVAHGACLHSGKPAPGESLQRELADELRARVADEFVKRRKDTEWFIEGDFDSYITEIRKPNVWGGEPELLMATHVLKMPITVYMKDRDSGGLISIAEYGQEYGKENPIRVLYHGFGHYDALHIPVDKNNKGRRKREPWRTAGSKMSALC